MIEKLFSRLGRNNGSSGGKRPDAKGSHILPLWQDRLDRAMREAEQRSIETIRREVRAAMAVELETTKAEIAQLRRELDEMRQTPIT